MFAKHEVDGPILHIPAVVGTMVFGLLYALVMEISFKKDNLVGSGPAHINSLDS